ncbi:MAG: hypothetical protein AAFP84_21130, partial [Actinomycetota bacterium]
MAVVCMFLMPFVLGGTDAGGRSGDIAAPANATVRADREAAQVLADRGACGFGLSGLIELRDGRLATVVRLNQFDANPFDDPELELTFVGTAPLPVLDPPA